MSRTDFMIYGANGYTGELAAEEAVRRGHRPLLAGRSLEKLAPIAERLGLEAVAVSLDDAAGLRGALERVRVVLHAAGPFIDTSEPMVRACLAARTHYLDVTGEISVFRNTFDHDAQARAAGVLLLSGTGFDVVPSDCLALHVARQVPRATRLEIGIAGLGEVSPGTLKSMFDGSLAGGFVRRDGVLVPHQVGRGARTLRFADKGRLAMPIPWGDLETAYRTTGIQNITTYMAYPSRMVSVARLSWPLLALSRPLLRTTLGNERMRAAVGRRIAARVKGPDAEARRRGYCQLWARASDADGHGAQAWMETVEGYEFTARAFVRAAERTLALELQGALTPALAFGKDFALEIEGTRRFDSLPAGGA